MVTKKAPVKAAPVKAPVKAAAPAPKVKVAAPAPAPAPEEVEEGAVPEVGSYVTFLGYAEDVPANERFLEANTAYEVTGYTEPDGEEGKEGYDPGGDILVNAPNPNFNSKKKAHPDTNPENVNVALFPDEYEPYVEEEGAAEAEAAEEVAAPAPAPAAKVKAKVAAPAPAPAPAAKGKAVAAKKTAAPAEAEVEAVDPDALPDLEHEDAAVLELVGDGSDLIAVAQDLEKQASTTEYQLGGIFYHIKKSGAYEGLEDEVPEGERQYTGKGGFGRFLKDYFNCEYRKAMYLIKIYVAFSLAEIENPAEHVATIGWAKAAKIAGLLNEEGQDPAELIELATNSTSEDLSIALKEQVEVGATKTPGTTVTRITFKFRLLEAEAASVNATLEAVRQAQGLKDIGEALVYIVNDWQTQNAPATTKSAPVQKAVAKPAAKPVAKRVAA